MSLTWRHDAAGDMPIDLDNTPGVYKARCPYCKTIFIAGEQSRTLIIHNTTRRTIACPRCWTPKRQQALQDRIERINQLIPDDPFEGFPKGHAA